MHPKLEMMGADTAATKAEAPKPGATKPDTTKPAAPRKGSLAAVDALAAGITSRADATRLLTAAANDLAAARKAIESQSVPYAAFGYVRQVRDWTKKAADKLEKDGLTPKTKRYVASASLQSAEAFKLLGKMAGEPGLGQDIIDAAKMILRKTGKIIQEAGEPLWIGAAAVGIAVLLLKGRD